MLCKPDGLRCRGVNRISGEAEYRRSREERARDAGRMAVEPRARLYHGESATVSRKIDSLSPEERKRDAGRMAVEPRARLYHGEKCYGFTENQFTFPQEDRCTPAGPV